MMDYCSGMLAHNFPNHKIPTCGELCCGLSASPPMYRTDCRPCNSVTWGGCGSTLSLLFIYNSEGHYTQFKIHVHLWDQICH